MFSFWRLPHLIYRWSKWKCENISSLKIKNLLYFLIWEAVFNDLGLDGKLRFSSLHPWDPFFWESSKTIEINWNCFNGLWRFPENGSHGWRDENLSFPSRPRSLKTASYIRKYRRFLILSLEMFSHFILITDFLIIFSCCTGLSWRVCGWFKLVKALSLLVLKKYGLILKVELNDYFLIIKKRARMISYRIRRYSCIFFSNELNFPWKTEKYFNPSISTNIGEPI